MAVTKVKGKTKSLSTLFRRTIEKVVKASAPRSAPSETSPAPEAKEASSSDGFTLKDFVNSIHDPFTDRPDAAADKGRNMFRDQISSLLSGNHEGETLASSLHPENIKDATSSTEALVIPWFPAMLNSHIAIKRKEAYREKKSKFVFKSGQSLRFKRLIQNCATKLGSDATFQMFGRLGRETGIKEYNAMISVHIGNAMASRDVEVVLGEIEKAFELFKIMRKRGFPTEEETYGQLLNYLIDVEMVEEFQNFSDIILEANPSSSPRLGYYEMLLWITLNDEEKIREYCNAIAYSGENFSSLEENYLVALCERDRKEDLQLLFETVDITKFSSLVNLTSMFQFLGRFLFDSTTKKFLRELRNSDYWVENVSDLIYGYATSIPNIGVDDVVLKCKELNKELEILPTSSSYEKLIKYCCRSPKVHAALDLVEEMCKATLSPSLDLLHTILFACEESYEFNLVHRIYSLMLNSNLKPNSESFRIMISLCVKMKDFEGAYSMLNDLEKLNLARTTNIYNVLMGGYFREKNVKGALLVLKQMEAADVRPDSTTFSYLINNCDREEDIAKYCEELDKAGIKGNKYISMSLVNAYVSCGQFEKAKQIAFDETFSAKQVDEVKSVLITALAVNGKFSEALSMYEEMKQRGSTVDPKSNIALIEYIEPEMELSTLLQLLEELQDSDYWMDGCCRAILFCIRNQHSSSALDLLRKLTDKLSRDDVATEYFLDEVCSVIAETESPDLQLGLDILQFIKDELGFPPSRKCLDFLLSACVNAKDKKISLLIWKEYQAAGLPYNVLSFLRMYQALLASGDYETAKTVLNRIPDDDSHVRVVVEGCQSTYTRKRNKGSTKKGKKKLEKKEK